MKCMSNSWYMLAQIKRTHISSFLESSKLNIVHGSLMKWTYIFTCQYWVEVAYCIFCFAYILFNYEIGILVNGKIVAHNWMTIACMLHLMIAKSIWKFSKPLEASQCDENNYLTLLFKIENKHILEGTLQ